MRVSRLVKLDPLDVSRHGHPGWALYTIVPGFVDDPPRRRRALTEKTQKRRTFALVVPRMV
jgi:hypothetical protein